MSLYPFASSTPTLQQMTRWPQGVFCSYKINLTASNFLPSVKDTSIKI